MNVNPKWNPIDEETYDEALGVLPPAKQTGNGFLMGEPATHRICTTHGRMASTFHAYIQKGDRFFKSDRPLNGR